MRTKWNECATARLSARLGAALAALGLAWLWFPLNGRAQSSLEPFTVDRYVIDAELSPSTHTLTASVEIHFTPQADLRSLSFELNSALKVSKVLNASGPELGFHQDGRPLARIFLTRSSPGALRPSP